MPTRSVDSQSRKTVPIEYSGKWIAWTSDHTRIVAQSDTIQDLWRLVRENRISDPVFEKVPRSDVRVVGKR